MFFAAAIFSQQQRYINLLIDAGAINEESAVFPSKVGIPMNQAFRNLIWRKKVIKTEDGKCFVNNK